MVLECYLIKYKSCISLLSYSSIRLVYNIFESDSSAGRLNVPFTVTSHNYPIKHPCPIGHLQKGSKGECVKGGGAPCDQLTIGLWCDPTWNHTQTVHYYMLCIDSVWYCTIIYYTMCAYDSRVIAWLHHMNWLLAPPPPSAKVMWKCP